MKYLFQALTALPEYRAVREAADSGKCVCLSGLSPIHRAHFLGALRSDTGRPLVAVCADEEAARQTADELRAFVSQPVTVLPDRELTLYDTAALSHGWEQKRLRVLYDLAGGKIPILVASLAALRVRTMPKSTLYTAAVRLQVGADYRMEDLVSQLVRAGYARTTLVEGTGQFALRGCILDVFSPAMDNPVRCEFFGDALDAMGYFDTVTQRRIEPIESAVLLPSAEVLPALHPDGTAGVIAALEAVIARQRRRKTPHTALLETLTRDLERLGSGVSFAAADRYLSLIYPALQCGADYVSGDAIVAFCDHGAVSRAARKQEESFGAQLDAMLNDGVLAGELCEFYRDWDDLCGTFSGRGAVYLDNFLTAAFPETLQPQALLSVACKQLPSYGGNLEIAADDLSAYQKSGFRSLVLCGNRRRGELLQQMLESRGVRALLDFPLSRPPEKGEIVLTDGALGAGMEYPALELAVLTEGQLTGRREKRKPRRDTRTNRQKLTAFTDLSPGDLVVHEHHGIGRYMGMEPMKVDGVVKDYVKIAYRGTDVLYVPATQLDLVSKYIGAGEEQAVNLNKLGGDAWERAKTKAKTAVKDLADGLIQLYAARARAVGFAFSSDSPWQAEFEERFEYAETDDQLRAIAEIKADMEKPKPMERLLCGDVGFGKTEVALRAAMKAMLDGKQVAILVPTTVLAQQHYLTCMKRFAGFPVNIDVLSRFRTAAQQTKTLKALATGQLDLVVGTHKLLNKELRFKDLGLLIIDEEQRFGVSHKERLKEMSKDVDVLTLSATPIPRTLNMAMSGIRDMSTIEEPPSDRFPVQTIVMEHDDRILDDAIRREIARGGQVYYLHNRIESIAQCAYRMQQRIPEASIAVAHGRMGEEALGDVMQKLSDGDVQVLVCTSIIETGIDIPNVNTLIIENADSLGLSQLHQLRGRVGRSSRHAFAYLTFRRGKQLSEVAEKRLGAVREFAEFGSGFKIAMRDLEIRGAGNLLGAEQSGHLLSVGYDMYLKLLQEAVLEQSDQKALPECTADLSIAASIPKSYVSSGEQRMDLYRRMAAVRDQADADDLLSELVDRYGEVPKSVRNLIDTALLRATAAAAGITEIAQKSDKIVFTMRVLNFQTVSAICADPACKGRVFFAAAKTSTPQLTLKLAAGEDPLKAAKLFLARFDRLGAADAT
ncbi:MAG: transcription-repair coupling factor [Oscillospiraceae bacterium]|nr:transcription-repair coupling factor [Oscillospiraceae bacterium]